MIMNDPPKKEDEAVINKLIIKMLIKSFFSVLKLTDLVRTLAYIIIFYLIFKETGPWTIVFFTLISIRMEAELYIQRLLVKIKNQEKDEEKLIAILVELIKNKM